MVVGQTVLGKRSDLYLSYIIFIPLRGVSIELACSEIREVESILWLGKHTASEDACCGVHCLGRHFCFRFWWNHLVDEHFYLLSRRIPRGIRLEAR